VHLTLPLSSCTRTRTFALLLGGVLTLACERRETSTPVMTPASGTASSVERASEDVTAARCDREARCDHVGPEEDFTSREDCMRSLWSDTYSALSACDSGIERQPLQQCIAAIGSDDCKNVLGRLDGYPACKLVELCAD
jgi:hypothetical protein